MIRKTVKNYRRRSLTWAKSKDKISDHVEEIVKETWWLLCIPIYSREILMKSNI